MLARIFSRNIFTFYNAVIFFGSLIKKLRSDKGHKFLTFVQDKIQTQILLLIDVGTFLSIDKHMIIGFELDTNIDIQTKGNLQKVS